MVHLLLCQLPPPFYISTLRLKSKFFENIGPKNKKNLENRRL